MFGVEEWEGLLLDGCSFWLLIILHSAYDLDLSYITITIRISYTSNSANLFIVFYAAYTVHAR